MSEKSVADSQPLNVMDYVAGWGEGLIELDKKMRFTLTKTVLVKQIAQVAWIGQQLETWKDVLNEKSGAIVKECGIRVGKEYSKYYSSKVDDVSIVLLLAIPGLINAEKILNSEIKLLISGGIKKTLALDLLDRFPPPFNTVNPNFAAGVNDIIKLNTTNGQLGWDHSEIRKLNQNWEKIFQSKLNSILDIFDAKLVELILPKHTHDGAICFKLVYMKEKSLKERDDLELLLTRLLNGNNISCRNIN